MRFTGLLIFLLIFYIDLFSQAVEFEWADMCGNPPNTTDTRTTLASVDDGSFFMAGEFLDTALFGTKTMVSAGGSDIFLAKFDHSGNALWTLRMGGEDDEYIREILLDNEGNILVSGFFYGTSVIGTDVYTSYGSQDLFIAKFNPEGDFIWSFRAGGPMADYISGIAIVENQDIVMSGSYYNSIFIENDSLNAIAASDVFLAKINADGELQWTANAGGSSSDQLNSMTSDSEGNVFVAGSFYYDITIGDTTLTTLNPVGVFIAKYNADGSLENVFQLDGTYLCADILITAANSGDFYISGCFSEDITFGDKTFSAGEFNQDLYTAKYSNDCDLLWARHAFSFGSDQVVAMDTDEFGNLYITGHYLDTVHFELLTLNYTLCCGSREIFIVNYSSAGQVQWGRQVSGTRANIKSMEMTSQGKLLLSGLFTEELTVGPFSLSHYDGFRDYFTSLETGLFTSVKDYSDKNPLVIFPNPAKNRLSISWEDISYQLNYQIYGFDGRLFDCGLIRSGGTIDLDKLASGPFILRLSDPASELSFSRILIRE